MKVFGTGWQRTGTTSLGLALNHLGVRTLDSPTVLFEDPEHPCLQQFDGFVDNPIPLIYQDLDRLQPGSRYIHTERPEEDWLASARWLFGPGREVFRWSRRPIIGRIHRALYGTSEYDPEVFLTRYRRHNREVRDYFASRPGDLLIMNVAGGEGYEVLCPFLGLPVPDEPFPAANRRTRGWRIELRSKLREWGRVRRRRR